MANKPSLPTTVDELVMISLSAEKPVNGWHYFSNYDPLEIMAWLENCASILLPYVRITKFHNRYDHYHVILEINIGNVWFTISDTSDETCNRIIQKFIFLESQNRDSKFRNINGI